MYSYLQIFQMKKKKKEFTERWVKIVTETSKTEKTSHVMGKPAYTICEQQTQTSLRIQSTGAVHEIWTLSSFSSRAGQVESCLVGNLRRQFFHDMARIKIQIREQDGWDKHIYYKLYT